MSDLQTELAALIAEADRVWDETMPDASLHEFIAERLASSFTHVGWANRNIHILSEFPNGQGYIFANKIDDDDVAVYRFARPAHSEETQQ